MNGTGSPADDRFFRGILLWLCRFFLHRETGGRTPSSPPFKDAARVDILLYAQVGGIQEQKNECVLHTGLHKVCHEVCFSFFRQADTVPGRVTIHHGNVIFPAVMQDTGRGNGEGGLAGSSLPAGKCDK